MSKIKEEIKGKSYNQLSTTANIAPEIQEIILKSKRQALSFNAVKIILLLSANLKDRQFKKHTKKQLDLFDNEWFEVDNNIDYSVQLNFKFSDFLPKGNKNYSQVKDGIDELQEFNHTIEFQRTEKEGRIRNFKLKSAFISSYIMEEGNGFKITINNYWFRTLLNITHRFNPYLKSIIFNLNHNSLIFYFYLKTLPIINSEDYNDMMDKIGHHAKKIKGTIIKQENFVKIFDSNRRYESDIRRKLLDPIRNDLNKFSDISFNYKFEDRKIKIVTYEVGKVQVAEKLIKDDEINKIRNAMNYKVKKYLLSRVDAMFLLEIYVKYTYELVFKASNKNRRLRGKTGTEYINEYQKLMEDYVIVNNINPDDLGYDEKPKSKETPQEKKIRKEREEKETPKEKEIREAKEAREAKKNTVKMRNELREKISDWKFTEKV